MTPALNDRQREMPGARALERTPAVGVARSDDAFSRIPGHWLILARTAWILVTGLAVTLFIVSLPTYYDQLRTTCTGSACISHQITPERARVLQENGLSVDLYAAYSVALAVLFTGVYLVIAAVIFWRASRERMAVLAALMLVLFGVVFPETPRALVTHPFWHWPVFVLSFVGFVSAILFFNLFPSGRFVPRWTLWAALAWIVVAGQGIFFPYSTDRLWASLLNTLGFVCAASASLAALVYRYLRRADAIQRQQVKWVVFGVTTGLGGVVGVALLGVVFPALGLSGLFDVLGVRTAQIFLLLLVPLSIGLATLRYRLWDIDPIINRTLVYGTLTASVVVLYMLVVGGLGMLLQVRGNLLVSILAAGLVAVLFQPLRDRLQRGVNRLMYGERDDPYAVLSRLGQRLEGTLAPDELGLIGALREVPTQYGTNGLRISVEAPENLPPLPTAVEVAAYRIAQEAMTNVVRHARAKNCVVRLAVGEALQLEIDDDGMGVPAERRSTGVGLHSMRERAAELGGTCVIEPSAAGGNPRAGPFTPVR